MDSIVDGIVRFGAEVFPRQRSLYRHLAQHGQEPKALVISCSDSRVMPEVIAQCDPGTIFVTRNAGNVVPSFGTNDGAVASAIEYALVGLKVEHIIVCGHSDCGAMKALLTPDALNGMPAVRDWLAHCRCSHDVFRAKHPTMGGKDAARQLAMENVATQLKHLQTHPCVAARLAANKLTLHGWLFDIETGTVLAMNGDDGTFAPIGKHETLPVAVPRKSPAAEPPQNLVAAE